MFPVYIEMIRHLELIAIYFTTPKQYAKPGLFEEQFAGPIGVAMKKKKRKSLTEPETEHSSKST